MLKEGTEAVGIRVRVRVIKNKAAAPHREAEFDIEYGHGISREGAVLDVAEDHGLVTRSGSHYSIGETKLGNGRLNAKAFLQDNPELVDSLEAQINEKLAMPV